MYNIDGHRASIGEGRWWLWLLLLWWSFPASVCFLGGLILQTAKDSHGGGVGLAELGGIAHVDVHDGLMVMNSIDHGGSCGCY